MVPGVFTPRCFVSSHRHDRVISTLTMLARSGWVSASTESRRLKRGRATSWNQSPALLLCRFSFAVRGQSEFHEIHSVVTGNFEVTNFAKVTSKYLWTEDGSGSQKDSSLSVYKCWFKQRRGKNNVHRALQKLGLRPFDCVGMMMQ